MSKFLTYEKRLEIQKYLKENLSFGEISRWIGKDRTTKSRKIKKHLMRKKYDMLKTRLTGYAILCFWKIHIDMENNS